MTTHSPDSPTGSLFGRSRAAVEEALTDREEVACPLCDARPYRFGVDFQGLSLARCPTCGLEFQSPRPTFEQLTREVYGDAYHPPAHAGLDATQAAHYGRQLACLEEAVGAGRRTLLDVGCGAAAFVRYGADRGWTVDGTDVVVTEWARRTGARLWEGQLPSINFGVDDQPQYDVVRFNHVLEHTPDPLAELRRAHDLLSSGGIVLVGVPNMAGLSIRLKSWQSRLGLKRKSWKHYGALHHLWFFTPPTLTRLMDKAGFDVMRWETAVMRNQGSSLMQRVVSTARRPLERFRLGGVFDLYARRRGQATRAPVAGGNLTRAEQEAAEAFQLYRLAAEQGIAGAQARLGVMYAEGHGVTQDHSESVRWFRLAADQGDAEAQGGLGLAYATGRGIPQDFAASYLWLTLAADGLAGVTREGALKCRDSIASGLPADAVETAQRLARQWKPIAER